MTEYCVQLGSGAFFLPSSSIESSHGCLCVLSSASDPSADAGTPFPSRPPSSISLLNPPAPCKTPGPISTPNDPSPAFPAFDFAAHSWLKLPLRFVTATTSHSIFRGRGLACAASARGRLLLQPRSQPYIRDPIFFVCNSLSNTVEALPPCHTIVRGFAVCQNGEGLDVAVVGKAQTVLVVEIYRSKSRSWELVASLPRRGFLLKRRQMIECSGFLYALLLKPRSMLVVREAGGDEWSLQALPVEEPKMLLHLVSCQKALYMVGCTQRPISVRIWTFEPKAREWQTLVTMPHDVSRDLCETSIYLDCVGVGKFICFRGLWSSKVLTYDLTNESWKWLPEIPFPSSIVVIHGYEWEARLD